MCVNLGGIFEFVSHSSDECFFCTGFKIRYPIQQVGITCAPAPSHMFANFQLISVWTCRHRIVTQKTHYSQTHPHSWRKVRRARARRDCSNKFTRNCSKIIANVRVSLIRFSLVSCKSCRFTVLQLKSSHWVALHSRSSISIVSYYSELFRFFSSKKQKFKKILKVCYQVLDFFPDIIFGFVEKKYRY